MKKLLTLTILLTTLISCSQEKGIEEYTCEDVFHSNQLKLTIDLQKNTFKLDKNILEITRKNADFLVIDTNLFFFNRQSKNIYFTPTSHTVNPNAEGKVKDIDFELYELKNYQSITDLQYTCF